ncbi:MAG: hypothetical protein ACLGHQ_13395 [Acidimicrobiia bacterium]
MRHTPNGTIARGRLRRSPRITATIVGAVVMTPFATIAVAVPADDPDRTTAAATEAAMGDQVVTVPMRGDDRSRPTFCPDELPDPAAACLR